MGAFLWPNQTRDLKKREPSHTLHPVQPPRTQHRAEKGEKKVCRGSRQYPARWASVSSTVKGTYEGSSAGKESACNAEDPSSIPGSESSPGERIGLPLQYSWASLVAQLVKNLPAMRETWVQSLGWEDVLEDCMATHSSILTGESPWTEEPGRQQPMGSHRVRHD